eukprot:7543981-Ditylum_brightwellii.AAC.1
MKVAVISAYHVCDNTLSNAGPSTYWKQQWCYFRKKGHQNPDPQKLFYCNFTRFIDSRLEKDKELIIGINANETDEETSNLHKFLRETDLVDAFRHAHLNVTPPNTFQR